MTRTYCDGCGSELKSDDNVCTGGTVSKSRLGTTLQKGKSAIMIEIMIGKDGAWNQGDWCKYCVIDAVTNLDDRPRAA